MSEKKINESTIRIEPTADSSQAAKDNVPGKDRDYNPEVRQRVRRRYLTAGYKLKILSQVDALRGDSLAIAALLRREGLYASHLSIWRRQMASHASEAFSKTRGRKPKHDARDLEISHLQKENETLRTWKRQAEFIIDAQKKIAQILGNPVQEENLPKLPELNMDLQDRRRKR